MIKVVVIGVVIIAIIALVSYVVLSLVKRFKPVPPVREVEEARRILYELQVKDEILAILPESTRQEVDEYLHATRRQS